MTDKNTDTLSKLSIELLRKRCMGVPGVESMSYMSDVESMVDKAYSTITYQDPILVTMTKTITERDTYHDQKAVEMILSWREKYPLSKRVVSDRIVTIDNGESRLEGYWHGDKVICYITSPKVTTFIEIPKYACVWKNKDSQEYLLSLLAGSER